MRMSTRRDRDPLGDNDGVDERGGLHKPWSWSLCSSLAHFRAKSLPPPPSPPRLLLSLVLPTLPLAFAPLRLYVDSQPRQLF